MKVSSKRPAAKRGPQGQTKRAKKKEAYEDDDDTFFLNDDEDKKKADEQDEDDEEDHETADQLRLRLAREYLTKLEDEDDERDERRGVTGGSDDDEDAEEEEDAEDDDDEGGRALDAAARAQRLADRLQQDVAQAQGRLQRRLAHRVRVLTPGSPGYTAPCCSRGHRLSATAVALTSDDATAFTVSKDGGVCRWDVETMKRTQLYRDGTHMLMSCSADRTVKLWSLADRAYMDTLYGHQAEVLALDCLRAERVVTAGHDHTARLWKIPEESQLIFRAHDRVLDCVRFVTSTEWVSGGCDGGLHLWSQLKKKPVFVARGAHGPEAGAVYAAPAAAAAAGGEEGAVGAVGGGAAPELGWVTSVAVCKNSDLVASGAGDGAIRLWSVNPSKTGGAGGLSCLGALPQRGFVNGLAIARSGRFLVAAVGQEPRMGRWAREPRARNGLALHRLGWE
ncbi:hypothetical protein Agub_g4327 [Astrephomene gubernaculifera]|uniref:Uncharacterized protein n=1 Tax=Astrephomene gubernaculifera TaxID=47775 RepID=A0AAD3HK34_9CHLO|nr:hypothetical protein Agub_g4327 [Astrephomene gubernaculifera]